YTSVERDKRGRVKDSYSHREVAWWIMSKVCEQGWEPFDASGIAQYDVKYYNNNMSYNNMSYPNESGHFFLRLVA
ncbi:MAG: hypothetical protein Q7R39_04375, partial [Dehalococcoidia bacterium]|nr:hypothetical protein [Dehalococcoidia bacterium]